MQQLTEYPGPSEDDYDNVRALNTAFIAATSTLKGPQRGRLAATPFLLLSLRENDFDWWQRVLADERQGDLIADSELQDTELCRIQTTALSFLWQLAQRNSYAARLVSGASTTWCEKITELPLLTLLDRVGTRGDLIESRLYHLGTAGERLLASGTSASQVLQRSSQLSALQSLLTRPGFDSYVRLPAAACHLSGPTKVVEQ